MKMRTEDSLEAGDFVSRYRNGVVGNLARFARNLRVATTPTLSDTERFAGPCGPTHIAMKIGTWDAR
jgi:hypothetical protein